VQSQNLSVARNSLRHLVLGASYGGGWTVGTSEPGAPPPQPGSVRQPHAMMIANNILKVAPAAKLFDLPLVPVKISNIQAFLSFADAAYQRVFMDVALWRLGQFPGPWNPWGIYDRSSEFPLGHYTENPNSPFNLLVAGALAQNIDVVFAAGNCRQFCPDNRCGGRDRGPSRSIWGANSLESVLTVGALTAYGSATPRWGRISRDSAPTSRTCARRASSARTTTLSPSTPDRPQPAVSPQAWSRALRSRWNAATVSPHQLKQILNQTARKLTGLPWTNKLAHRLGHGILDVRAAFGRLQTQFP
jgi:hypothetical protein